MPERNGLRVVPGVVDKLMPVVTNSRTNFFRFERGTLRVIKVGIVFS